MKYCRFKLFFGYKEKDEEARPILLACSENGKVLWNLTKELRNYNVYMVDAEVCDGPYSYYYYDDADDAKPAEGDTSAPVYFTEVHIAKKTGKPHFYTDNNVEHTVGDTFEVHLEGIIDACVVLSDTYEVTAEKVIEVMETYKKVNPRYFERINLEGNDLVQTFGRIAMHISGFTYRGKEEEENELF